MINPSSSELMTANAVSPGDSRISVETNKKTVIVLLTALFVTITNIVIPPYRFADYYSYLLITDRLHYFISEPVITFEALSNGLFITLRWITNSTTGSVDLAHYILGFTYILFLHALSHRLDVKWQGLLIFVGCFGALLAFVTIRATPAYFFVTIAALEGTQGRLRSLLWAGIGILFHVSAFLAVIPLLTLLAYTRFDRLHWIQRATAPIVIGGIIYMTLFVVFRGFVTHSLQDLLSATPFLNKYIVYTQVDTDPLSVQKSSSTFHTAYAVVVSMFALFCFFVKGEKMEALRPYILSSYVIFQILEVSPITAYRQSIFWLAPVMLVFPWRSLIRSSLLNGAFVVLSTALFVYSANMVHP